MDGKRITKAQLSELKEKHGKVYHIEFNPVGVNENQNQNPEWDEDYPTLDFVFKKMDFELFAATTATAMERPIQSVQTQMTATLVYGDKEWLKDPVVFQSVMIDFSKINRARSSALKKI